MTARLPDALEDRSAIEHMQLGEERWAVPWAMWVSTDRRLWLHPGYSTTPGPFGTSSMRLVRTAEGYVVDTSHCPGERWTPVEQPSYVGGSGGSDWLPVAELIGP